MTETASSRARFSGLDGLRAVAVVMVLLYHAFPAGPFVGGFIGVDMFFVVSGFLITSLLLREIADTGRIALMRFWRRRARRLLPALAAVVTVCASVAGIVGGDVLTRLGTQVLSAATFSFNWVSLATGDDYFSAASPGTLAAATPDLFRNLWSLAVEEQFYLVWPLLLPALLLLRPRWSRSLVLAAAALASAGWMTGLLLSGTGMTRVYFGTDTHAFGILGGAALAVALDRQRQTRIDGVLAGRAGAVGGLGALAGLLALALVPTERDAAAFPVALIGASLLTVVTVAVAVSPGSLVGRLLDAAPLRWIGDRSYGLYLWHWPLFVLLSAAVGSTARDTPLVGATALLLTVVAAEMSYRLLEQPIRRRGLRGAAAGLRRAFRSPGRQRATAAASIVVAALALGGTSAAIAAAPAHTSAETAVEAGIAALGEAPSPTTAASPAPAPADSAYPGAVPSPAPSPVRGDDVTAIGDSVMLASAPALLDRLPGIRVDAEVSRSMYAAPAIVERLRDAGELRRYVVVALGTNGAVERETLDRLDAAIGPTRELVLVTAFADRDWIPGVNAELAAYAATHPRVEIADWSRAIASRTDLLAGDGIHPGDAGGRVFADAVDAAVERAEIERTQRVFRGGLSGWRLDGE